MGALHVAPDNHGFVTVKECESWFIYRCRVPESRWDIQHSVQAFASTSSQNTRNYHVCSYDHLNY
jgi:hypothetical protein